MSQQKQWARILASLRKKFCANPEELPEIQRLYLEQMSAKENGDDATARAIEESSKASIAVPIPFDREAMVEVAKIKAGENSTPEQMASGYLSSLQRWGYIRRHEKAETGKPGRPSYTYVVTDYGFKAHLQSMRAVVERDGVEIDFEADFQRLSAAIEDLGKAHGKRGEVDALKNLLKVHHDILESHKQLEG